MSASLVGSEMCIRDSCKASLKRAAVACCNSENVDLAAFGAGGGCGGCGVLLLGTAVKRLRTELAPAPADAGLAAGGGGGFGVRLPALPAPFAALGALGAAVVGCLEGG
eukprot:10157048-Alexandrium_andersonii.AAC.1